MDSQSAPNISPDQAAPAARIAEAVVAVGASAGGLDALDRYFAALAPDLPAAFVVIQHLAPDHRTMMDTLLARQTRMKVQVAHQDDPLREGEVYVIPAGMTMSVVDRRLHLDKRPTHGLMHPINTFFESLAHAGADRVVAIVLSGTGSDGSEGVRTIAESGGWVLVQDPKTAAFDGMPRNAIATGRVHDTGTPEDLARLTMAIIREKRDADLVAIEPDPSLSIEEILSQCSKAIGIDLTNYKPHTLIRRLERRVLATGHSGISSYLKILTDQPEEGAALRREMMIPVTAFFRDQEAFDDLRRLVITPAMAALVGKQTRVFRAWVVGCATGQEAYSIAILAHEVARGLGLDVEIKIFATDIEPSYVETAGLGRYSARAVDSLPEDLRLRYFDQVDEGLFQVTPRLRRSIVFSQHDALTDPPFLHLDLVTCRNMIIYLRPNAQERVLKRFLFGLVEGGALFLGSSESTGALSGLLDTLSPRNKLYRLRTRVRHLSSDDIMVAMERRDPSILRPRTLRAPEPFQNATHALSPATATIIDAFAPPSVVIDANREIRHVFGDVTGFLRFMPGNASLDLAQLLPARTGAILSTLIFSALRDKVGLKTVILHPADDPDYKTANPVRISLRPIKQVEGSDATRQLLVSFEHLRDAPLDQPAQSDDLAAMSAGRARALESELDDVRATLKSTIEDLGSANEELQASNEELMASNEELQSTNEELQSVNEELHTVNAEFQNKIVQLHEAYADLENLSRAARIPLIFLDRNFCITRFSAQATELFRLRDQDLGRPLFDITHDLDVPDLEQQVRDALAGEDMRRIEARSRDGRSWLITVQPFVGKLPEASRIVLSMIDVSSVRAMRHLQSVVDAMPQNLVVLDAKGVITQVNAAWRQFAQDNNGTDILTSGTGLNYLDALRRASASDETAHAALDGITAILSGQRASFELIYPCHSKTAKRWFLMHAAPLDSGGCVVAHLDITALRTPSDQKAAP